MDPSCKIDHRLGAKLRRIVAERMSREAMAMWCFVAPTEHNNLEIFFIDNKFFLSKLDEFLEN